MKWIKNLFSKIKSFKRYKLIIAVVLVVVVAVAGFSIWRSRASQVSALDSEQRTATAGNGGLVINLSGSGAVAAGQRKDIQSQVAGTVSESFLEEGKAVKAGDVLVKLESQDADINLQKMENSLKQKELAASQQQDQLDSLEVKAPINGRISGLSLKVGDTVNKGQVLCSIADESSIELRAQFKGVSSKQLGNAQTVQVNIPDYSATLEAKVESLTQSGSDTEALLSINNPGALSSGIAANAEIISNGGDFISEQGTLEWSTQETVKAGASGTVSDISALENQYVGQGKVLLTLENDELATTVESSNLDLDQAQKDLDQAKANMNNYTITAPFDGVLVSAADLKSGDDIKAGMALVTLIDTTQMTMQISIDELDISQVKPGQVVSITLDALEDTATKPISGKVDFVAVEGSPSNGVTSYPVTITFPGREDLKVGMNASAEILVLNKQNVLLVPFEAVQKKGNSYYVWVKTDGAAATGDTGTTNNQQGNRNQGIMGQLTPEQQQQVQNMTPEERQKLRDQYMQQPGDTANQGGNTADQPGNAVGQNGNTTDQTSNGTGQTGNATDKNGSGSGTSGNTDQSGNGTANASESATPSGNGTGSGNGQNGNRMRNLPGGQASQNPYYAGAVQVVVTVGDHNENFMEITSGLNAGDVVVLPQITANASSSSSNNLKQSGNVMGMPVGGATLIQGGNNAYRRGGD